MGNEVSAQRVTFGSHPQSEQVDQETSLNTEAPFTKKRKLEDFEESLSSQIPNKRRKLNQNEDGSHIIHTPKSLIIILKCGRFLYLSLASTWLLTRLKILYHRFKACLKTEERQKQGKMALLVEKQRCPRQFWIGWINKDWIIWMETNRRKDAWESNGKRQRAAKLDVIQLEPHLQSV